MATSITAGARNSATSTSPRPAVERRRFGKTDLEVSVLGFGGAPVGFLDAEQQQVTTMLNALLDRGVNLIDTAHGYPGSEQLIGRAVGRRRDQFTLVTKCGNAGEPDDPKAWTRKTLTGQIDESLARLGFDHIDVILLHSCSRKVLEHGEAVQALVEARDAGKVRFVGYSGDNEAAAFAAAMPEIAVLQTSINICDQRNIDAVLPAARKHDVGVIAKRPIANAAWKDLSEQRGLYTSYAKDYTQRFAAMKLSLDDLGFREANPRDAWPAIAMRFTLSQPGVHTAIIGTTKLEHAEANLAALRDGPLPEETITKIRQAFAKAEAASGERWDGLI